MNPTFAGQTPINSWACHVSHGGFMLYVAVSWLIPGLRSRPKSHWSCKTQMQLLDHKNCRPDLFVWFGMVPRISKSIVWKLDVVCIQPVADRIKNVLHIRCIRLHWKKTYVDQTWSNGLTILFAFLGAKVRPSLPGNLAQFSRQHGHQVRANDPGMQDLHLESDIQQRLALLEEAECASGPTAAIFGWAVWHPTSFFCAHIMRSNHSWGIQNTGCCGKWNTTRL